MSKSDREGRRVSLTPLQLDRAVGAIVASATGDALGSAYEFGPGLSDREVPDFGTGVFGHERGEWTDDTAMAMPILEALARGESLLDADALATIVGRWLEWSATAKDVGVQTRSVLGRLGGDHSEAAARRAALAVHERSGRSAGNGSLMRTGPVALGFLGDGLEPALVEAAGRIARLTHHEQDNVDAVVLWSLAVRHAIRTGEFDPTVGLEWVGVSVEGVSTSSTNGGGSTSGGGVSTGSTGDRERWAALIDEALAPGARPRDFRAKNGWVVKAFQGALAAVAGASDVRDALIRAVRGGGDTDTVAAIAGSLAGAVWGATQVPLGWQRLLHGWPGHDANDLTRLGVLAARGGRPDAVGWPSADVVPSGQFLHTEPRRHPHDAGVWLGSQSALRDLPSTVGAVVSLGRVGAAEIPDGVESVRVWLVDQPGRNANLDWTVADAADVIAELRSGGSRQARPTEVFVHCAEARSRTAAVAALYGVRHRGVGVEQAWRDVAGVLPHFAPAEFLRDAVSRVAASDPKSPGWAAWKQAPRDRAAEGVAERIASSLRMLRGTGSSFTVEVGDVFFQAASYDRDQVLVEIAAERFMRGRVLPSGSHRRLMELGFGRPTRTWPNWWIAMEQGRDDELLDAARAVTTALLTVHRVPIAKLAEAAGFELDPWDHAEAALAASKVELRAEHRPDGSSLYLEAWLDDARNLHLDGRDLGPVTRPVSPDGEYEYFMTIAAADVPRVVELLGGAPGENVLRLLAGCWSGSASHELERILRESDIPIELRWC